MPMNWLGKRLAFALRRLGLKRIAKQVDVEVFGQRVRLYPFDNVCEKRVLFTPQMFDAEERAFLKEIAGTDFTFMDIGANVGLYSLWVSGQCGRSSKIVAVEPDPLTFSRLTYNLMTSGADNVAAEQMAIAAKEGAAKLTINRKNRGENRLSDEVSDPSSDQVIVDVITLCGLMDKHGIQQADAVKIDVEGHEFGILDGFFATTPKVRYPRYIIMESIHNRAEQDSVQLALNYGYSIHRQTRMNVILSLEAD